ncbi:MAG: hypothetical protein OEX12_10660 [Gammaproteobacteria bacterium]|nr:hypothetical protein [Gammaproteobacteria bacterium]
MKAKYECGREVELPNISYIRAHYILLKGTWGALLLGWLFVGLSILINWEVPSSGAVLIGCVIIAEILFERQPWRRWNSDMHGFIYLSRDPDEGRGHMLFQHLRSSDKNVSYISD